MQSQARYIAFFDLDRTITAMNSGHALILSARDMKMISRKELYVALYRAIMYKTRIIGAEGMIRSMGKWLKGETVERMGAISIRSVDNYLVKTIYRQAFDEIRHHRENNATTAILSSAVEEICIPLAARIGVEKVICTTMEENNGVYTGLPRGEYCYGEEKAVRIMSVCANEGYDLSQAYFYSDSSSDIAALSVVGNPVCVNPDRRLRKHARDKGWRIMEWKTKKT
jgi:HAD superfamily hydrolase (TIGR01490 family)